MKRNRQVVVNKNKKSRDPRFGELSTRKPLNEEKWKRSYNFIEEIQKQELLQLKLSLKKMKKLQKSGKIEEEDHEIKKLQRAVNILQEKQKAKREEDEYKKVKRQIRARESELVAKGKKPYYIQDSEIKKMYKCEKLNEIKVKHPKQYQKYMKRKERKQLKKTLNRIPQRRFV